VENNYEIPPIYVSITLHIEDVSGVRLM